MLTAWFDLYDTDAARALGITPPPVAADRIPARRRLRAALANTTALEHPQWDIS